MLREQVSRNLWTDPARTRYFLLPDDPRLPPGEFVLRTVTGRELRVEEGAAAAFEVSEAEAREWVKAEFGEMLDGVRAGVERFVEKLKQGPGGGAEETVNPHTEETDEPVVEPHESRP
ncbi:MAG TPA: hypothetical protein VF297_26825 [Pyrinomonadaceae bacterium]